MNIKALGALAVLWILVWLSAVVGLIWTAAHFIAKFW